MLLNRLPGCSGRNQTSKAQCGSALVPRFGGLRNRPRHAQSSCKPRLYTVSASPNAPPWESTLGTAVYISGIDAEQHIVQDPNRALWDRIMNSECPDYHSDDLLSNKEWRTLNVEGPIRHSSETQHLDALTEAESTSETCLSVHPGSVCCSVTKVHRDTASKTVVINMTTTVRQSDLTSSSSVSMTDLEQLGLLAGATRLREAAAALSSPANNYPQSIQSRHDTLLKALEHARILNACKSTNQFGHVTYKCLLEDPATNMQFNAIVKPSIEGDAWHRAGVEAVAYRVSRLLGMDYVPPCVYRKDVDVDWQHFDGCVFMYWAENGRELRTQPKHAWGTPPDVVLSDARILDVLIQNSDRHHGHFLFAEHWAHGSSSHGTWRGSMMPVFIDHAAGFRPEADVQLQHQNAFGTGETRHISAKTYLRLRCLDRAAVAAEVGDLLTPAEIDQIMRHRDVILNYFDDLVAKRGYQDVVVEHT